MKTEEKRGRGRVAIDGYKDLIKGSVSLTQEMWDYVHEVGEGNFNVGIRKVLNGLMDPAPQSAKRVKRAATPEDQYEAYCKREGLTPSPGGFNRWKSRNGF